MFGVPNRPLRACTIIPSLLLAEADSLLPRSQAALIQAVPTMNPGSTQVLFFSSLLLSSLELSDTKVYEP